MGFDTRDERASALGAGLSFLTVLPLADGGLSEGDRAHVLGLYSGFGDDETGPAYERTGVLGVGVALANNQNIVASILGYDVVGDGTSWGFYTSLACACYAVVNPVGGTTTKIRIYARNTNVSTAAVVNVALYTHNAGTNRPDDRIATAQITVPANSPEGWYEADLVTALTADATYWLAHITATGPTGFGIRWFSRDTNRHIYLTGQSSLPDPWPASGTRNTTQWLMYALYESASGNSYEGTVTLGVGAALERHVPPDSNLILSRW